MSGLWLDALRTCLSLVLMGMAIKLMDDSLDAEFDAEQGVRTLAARMGRAILPYTLLLGLISVLLDRDAAVVVFLGSYAVGMFANPREKLPSKAPAWLEIIIVMALAVILVNWRVALWGLAIMSAIDWLDDVLDVTTDCRSGQRNLAVKIGVVETLFLILIALTVAVLTDTYLTALVFVALPIVEIAAQATTQKIPVPPGGAFQQKDKGRGV